MSGLAGVGLGLLLGAATTCAAADVLPASGQLDCDDGGPGACEFFDPGSGLRVRLPTDWPMRRLRVITETGPAASARERYAERWLSIDYLPEEPANPEVSLLHAAVLRRRDWHRMAAQPGPPPGTEVAASTSLAVVAARTPANPYPPGSRDAQIFEALMPTLEEISLILTLGPDR